MDPRALIGPSSPLGYPAPYWFLALFKVVGFTLHMVPMNLWLAGTILAVLVRGRADGARMFSDRLMQQMPVIVALGVNFGIVPLLFTQVAYYRVFYPATILMAWPWFAIVGLLAVAYYGVYLYAAGLKEGGAGMTRLRRASGWTAAVLFVAISFVFANGFSLMTNLRAWPGLWQATSAAGAPMGTGLNVADPSLWPRWLLMLGLAVTTTAAYVVVDAGLFARRELEVYRSWAGGFACKLYALGLLWVAAAGSWYVFGAWSADLRQVMFSGPMAALTALTALGPALVLALIAAQRRGVRPRLAMTVGFAQLAVVALNAVSRQVVQNLELRPFLDVAAEPVRVQWSPLILFLALFVAGLVVIAWMVGQVVAAERRGAELSG
jgi:hypothetical protein